MKKRCSYFVVNYLVRIPWSRSRIFTNSKDFNANDVDIMVFEPCVLFSPCHSLGGGGIDDMVHYLVIMFKCQYLNNQKQLFQKVSTKTEKQLKKYLKQLHKQLFFVNE